jgi:ATP adenylyltransferase/5',5'''-P-1,P-4-tetraphosphate phosphorylase II
MSKIKVKVSGNALGFIGLLLTGASFVVDKLNQKQEMAEAAEKAVEKILKTK